MEGGQDSFLDITSNIVGILIILVMVAGVRATSSLGLPLTSEDDDAHRKRLVALSADADARLTNVYDETLNLRTQSQQIDDAIFRAEVEHAAAIDVISSFRAAIDIARSEDQSQQSVAATLKSQLDATSEQLAKAEHEIAWHAANPPAAQTLENRPTPLSRQVDGKEVHFRLAGGKVSEVPCELLLGKLQIEITSRQQEYMKESVIENQIGPIQDYMMRYRLVIFDTMAGSRGYGRRLELDYAEFEPLRQDQGEDIATALKTGSQFWQRLAVYKPNERTITLWVYPDSFEAYRHVRETLVARGYQVAARPCGPDQPISASPRGSKSSAQ
ncbi:MAG: hypothetical protein ACRC46_06995 [Thermoguttaceae bacterium]